MLNELFNQLIGLPASPENYAIVISGFFWAMFGFVINRYFSVKKGIAQNQLSPANFSLKYFIQNNWGNTLISVMVIIVALRFSQELLGIQITQYSAIGIGLGVDYLIKKIEHIKF